MGSITRSFANNIGSSGVLKSAAVTNATVEDVTSYDNASNPATLVLLSTQTASNSATISFTTGLDSSYDMYEFKFLNIKPVSASLFQFQGSTDGGSNYNITMTTTTFKAYHNEAGSDQNLTYDTGYDQAQGTSFQSLSLDNYTPAADESGNGYLKLFNPSSTTYVKHFVDCMMHIGNGYSINSYVSGYFNTTSAINAIQFKMSTGNFDGVIKMYGVKKN